MKRSLRYLLLSLTICITCVIQAQVYEWVDAQGEKQFSDKPPPDGIKAEQTVYEIHNIDEGLPEPLVIDPDRADRQRKEREARQQANLKACTEARKTLGIVSNRVRYNDEHGEQIQVTERERQAHVLQLQADVERYCR